MIEVAICAGAGLVVMLAIYGAFRLWDDLNSESK